MDREQRLRRVILICCHFARNMAYYRAGWKNKKLIKNTDFWIGVNGNCIDIALLEWCKLFGDRKANHSWEKIITDRTAFQAGLLETLGPGMNMEGFEYFAKQVRIYRDKFVAHLDNELVADIPGLDECWLSVKFYHKYLLEHETNSVLAHGLPSNLQIFYEAKFEEALIEYSK